MRRDALGPVVTNAEARREYEKLTRARDNLIRTSETSAADFSEYRIPERKPVINQAWYDDDGRLWVFLWPAESDAMYRAQVYDADGALLHVAEWPRGILIWYGGLRGDVALGVREVEFDVQQVVRLRFSPLDEPGP